MGLSVDIQKHFRDYQLHISLDTDRQPLGILGASGCGKSITLKCIAGIERPDSGRIRLGERVLFDSSRKIFLPPQKRKVGYLFQNYALFPHMTVEENIAAGLQGPKEQIRERIDEMIASFHLQGYEKRYPAQLSGGQQQRVALARIMAYEPEALLLDEPFSALDTYLREKLLDQMEELLGVYRGEVILVTHNPREIYRLCQKILIMGNGEVLKCGGIDEISESLALAELEKVYENAYTRKDE